MQQKEKMKTTIVIWIQGSIGIEIMKKVLVSCLNELGVPQETYEGLSRNKELLRSMAMASCRGISEEFTQRRLARTTRHMVYIMYKYVSTHSMRQIHDSINHLDIRD